MDNILLNARYLIILGNLHSNKSKFLIIPLRGIHFSLIIHLMQEHDELSGKVSDCQLPVNVFFSMVWKEGNNFMA